MSETRKSSIIPSRSVISGLALFGIICLTGVAFADDHKTAEVHSASQPTIQAVIAEVVATSQPAVGESSPASQPVKKFTTVDEVSAALIGAGIPEDKVRQLISVVRRASSAAQQQGEDFQLNQRMQTFLKDRMELTDDQISKVIDIARNFQPEKNQAAANPRDRMTTALAEAGIPEDKLESVMSAARRISRSMRQEGESFVLSEEIQKQLSGELGLTEEQISSVVELAKKFSAGNNTNRRVRESVSPDAEPAPATRVIRQQNAAPRGRGYGQAPEAESQTEEKTETE